MHEQALASAPPRRASWQSLLARLIFGLALAVLAYGFLLRPWLSQQIGRQVGQEIRSQLAAQIAAELSAAAPAEARPAIDPIAAAPIAESQAGQAGASQVQLPADQPGAPQAQSSVGQPAGLPVSSDGQGASSAPPEDLGAAVAAQVGAAPEQAAAASSAGAAAAPAVATPIVAVAQPADASAPLPTPEPLATVLPSTIAALPSGELVLPEDKVNSRIADRLQGRGPIQAAVIRFVPGEIQASLEVLGTSNLLRAGLGVAGGRVVVRDPFLSGPLALVISANDLVDPIEEQINAALQVTDRAIVAVRVEQGRIVVTIE